MLRRLIDEVGQEMIEDNAALGEIVTTAGGFGSFEETLEAVRTLRRRLEPAPPAVVDQAKAAFA